MPGPEIGRLNADLLLWVERREFVSCQHIEKRFGYAHAVAARKLARLQNAGYLKRWRPDREILQPYSYYLTENGAQLLRRQYGLYEEDIPVRTNLRASTSIRHVLGINDFFCELLRASKDYRHPGLVRWLNSKESVLEVPRTGENLYPDSYGEFDTGNRMVLFFFEYDRHTEKSRELMAKLDKYALVLGTGAWRECQLAECPRVLFLTLQQDWAESVMHDFEIHLRRTNRAFLLYAHHFLFSSAENGHLHDVLGKRWLRAGSTHAPQTFFHV